MTQEIHSINADVLRRGGVVKLREENMFSLWVKTSCCNLNTRQLLKLADIADIYGRGLVLFTTRQIPIIPFVHLANVEKAKQEMARVQLELDRCGPRVRNINVCYEDRICPEAVTNSLSLGEKLDNFFRDSILHKIKIAVAGCRKDCVISRVLADIGFVGTIRENRTGYDAYVGGKLGVSPFVGVKVAELLTEGECLKLTQNYFDLLKKEGKEGERAAEVINRLGIEYVKAVLLHDLESAPDLKPVACANRLSEDATGKVILRIRATCGEVTSDKLRNIATLAEKYGSGFVHFVVRGGPEIPCVDKNDLPAIREELSAAGLSELDGGIDNFQSCFGGYCAESNTDPQPLLQDIEKKVAEIGLNNLKIKVSASGCPNSCGIAQLNDIGFFGVADPEVDPEHCNGCGICLSVCKRKALTLKDGIAVLDKENCRYCGQCLSVCPFDGMVEKRKGFAVFVGGKEGEDTRLGEKIAEFLSHEEALKIAERLLGLLKEKNTSAAALIDEIGLEKTRELLVSGKQ